MDTGLDNAKQRLDELGRLIKEKRGALERHQLVEDELRQEWDDMLRHHEELCRRSADSRGAARQTLHEDIDVLRHAFFRWAARVDRRFNSPKGSSK